MQRAIAIASAWVLGLAPLAGAARAASLDTESLGCKAPKISVPPLTSAQVTRDDIPTDWTSVYVFSKSGQWSTYCGDLKAKEGVASNAGASVKITGRWNGAWKIAKERIDIHIFDMPTDYWNANGKWFVETELKCPSDPWLTPVSCELKGKPQSHLWVSGAIGGPYPVSASGIPESKKKALVAKKSVIEVVSPKSGQVFQGGSVPLQLHSLGALELPTSQVEVVFQPPPAKQGQWPHTSIQRKMSLSGSDQVPFSEFKVGGQWNVKARLDWSGAEYGPPVSFQVVKGPLEARSGQIANQAQQAAPTVVPPGLPQGSSGGGSGGGRVASRTAQPGPMVVSPALRKPSPGAGSGGPSAPVAVPTILKPAPKAEYQGSVPVQLQSASGAPQSYALVFEKRKDKKWRPATVAGHESIPGTGKASIPASAFGGSGRWRVKAKSVNPNSGLSPAVEFRVKN